MKKLLCIFLLSFWLSALAQGTEISYVSFRTNPSELAIDTELINLYQEQTGNTVELSSINANDLRDAIRTYVSSTNPPDIIYWFAGERTCFFGENGLLQDVNDLWEENGWEEVYPEGMQRLSKCADGNYYFVPDSYYWWGVFYNQTVFDDAGIEVPETWDEYLQVCRDLRAAGYAPMALGSKDVWPASGVFDILNMRANGPQFHLDLLSGRESYESEEVAKTFAYWAEAIEAGCFMDDATAYDLNDSVGLMARNEAAMSVIGTFIMDIVPEEKREDIGFFRFPVIDTSLPLGEDAPTDGYIIPATAKNPEAAKAFAAVLGSKEGQEIIAKFGGRLVPRSDIDESIYSDLLLEGKTFIEESNYVAQFYNRDTRSEMEAAFPIFVDFMLNPSEIERIQSELQRLQERAFR